MARIVGKCTAAAAAVMLLASNATAELISPFGDIGAVRFTRGDIALLQHELRRLLVLGPDGAVGAWRNAQTGNFGTLQVTGSYRTKLGPCRTIAHIVKLKGNKDSRRFVVSYCRVGKTWKLAD